MEGLDNGMETVQSYASKMYSISTQSIMVIMTIV